MYTPVDFSDPDRPTINKMDTFLEVASSDRLLNWISSASFSNLIESMDNTVKALAPDISGGAFANAHGDWYEWLLLLSAWIYTAEDRASRAICVTLPNVVQFDVSRLYKDELFNYIVDLRRILKDESGVSLVTSNPDFAIISPDLASTIPIILDPDAVLTRPVLTAITEGFKHFDSKCKYEDILGYVSAKKSLRPDRRLQLPHEGSLFKALHIHLQTRLWMTDPLPLKYYAVAGRFNPADQRALETVATHSITTVQSKPTRAVDELFAVDSQDDANTVWGQILN